jgi:prevent-host-death family protein
MKEMAAGQFKAKCLAVMDKVQQSGEPVLITKRGKPVVKVMPVPQKEEQVFGYMAGKLKIEGDIIHTAPAEDWENE